MNKNELIEHLNELENEYQSALERRNNELADQIECELTYLSLLFSDLEKDQSNNEG